MLFHQSGFQEQLDRRIEVDDGILRFVLEMINRGVNEA